MIIFSNSGEAIVSMAKSGEARIPPVDPARPLPVTPDLFLDFPADPKSKFMLFFFVLRLPTSANNVAIILVGGVVGWVEGGLGRWDEGNLSLLIFGCCRFCPLSRSVFKKYVK